MADVRVGVVCGTRLPGNVRTFLTNVLDLLEDAAVEFTFDLLVRESVADESLPGEVVDLGLTETDRALETIRTLTGAVTEYARMANPDVLWQVTKFPGHGFATTVAGRRAGVPVLTRFAGDNFREYGFSDGIGERTRTFLLNNVLGRVPAAFSNATIVLGPYGREQITRRGGDTVYEIPQPIDRERFHPIDPDQREALRDDLGLPADERVLLTVGRLSRRKGMADLLDAARTLSEKWPNVRWCVVGDGPMRTRLASVATVDTVGSVPHERIPAYYRAADLVVHPSLAEGLPNVLLEAAACDTPTLARDVGDCAVAASETFEDPCRLPDLVRREYEPVDLGDRFDPATLRKAYTDALIETAGIGVPGRT